MAQKRKSPYQASRRSQKNLEFEGDRPSGRWPERILALLYETTQPLALASLEKQLRQLGCSGREFAASLDHLFQQGFLRKTGKALLTLHHSAPLYEGRLEQHPRGFGFVSRLSQRGSEVNLSRDPYVSPAAMGDARHGDRVLVRILRVRKDDRPEAVVVAITEPGSNRIAGLVSRYHKGLEVIPDDRRYPGTIAISDEGVVEGDAVIVAVQRSAGGLRRQQGKVVEVLGRYTDLATQFHLVTESFELPRCFPPEVEEEAAALLPDIIPGEGREDLRTVPHVTIDGESAKDFDDAVCVEKLRNGYRLYVSIADVAHYVTPGSAIDREAYARGTSVYFPGRVIPMLPERLCNDLCSLVPDEDRPTLSAILDFDRAGNLRRKRFCRSLIRSLQRFTYTAVAGILIDRDPDLRQRHKPLLTQLKWAAELAQALQQRRRERGSLDFNLHEAEFFLDEHGGVENIARIKRNFAHQMIEEFMLAANEAVATWATECQKALLYRIHEPPAAEKTEEFFTFATTLGLQLPLPTEHPSWYAAVLDLAKGGRHEYLVHNLLLRAMKQARYSPDNAGHFGLAAPLYTHFTSPIRRYPDLLVHRALLDLLDLGQRAADSPPFASLEQAGDALSARERTAILAERDMEERLKLIFMKDRIGESFPAIVSGVSDSALFLVIPEHCLSGAIAIDLLGDEYFLLDAANHRLFGEISAKTYRIGDPMQVTLVSVDIIGRRLNFAPCQTKPAPNQP